MKYIDKLFKIENAFDTSPETQEVFFKAVQEAFQHHFENCEIYRKVCLQEGFTPQDLKGPEDFPRIPHIMVHVFKWYTLQSLPSEEIAYEFTSSGTSGQKSHILWDEGSRQRQSTMRETIMKSYGLVSNELVNYLVFTYSPEVAGTKGAAYAQQMYTTFAPAREKFFAINPDQYGLPHFDEEGTIQHLIKFAKSGLPVRLVGFPAFMHETFQAMKARGIRLKFPPQSLVITAGGWKDKEDQKISQEAFAQEMEELLGIPGSQLRDIYGFVEHGVPYITCSHGHFHVPIYSRAYVRRPGTLELLPYGEKGLLHVISPYNLAQPALSILSTDYARIHRGCPCGIETDYIELMGRAGVRKHQGCAISATELLKHSPSPR